MLNLYNYLRYGDEVRSFIILFLSPYYYLLFLNKQKRQQAGHPVQILVSLYNHNVMQELKLLLKDLKTYSTPPNTKTQQLIKRTHQQIQALHSKSQSDKTHVCFYIH